MPNFFIKDEMENFILRGGKLIKQGLEDVGFNQYFPEEYRKNLQKYTGGLLNEKPLSEQIKTTEGMANLTLGFIGGGMENVGETLARKAVGIIKQESGKFKKPIFKGLKNLSTKLLEKFRGMPDEITEQEFRTVLNRAEKEGIRQADRDLIIGLAKPNTQGKINLTQLAKEAEIQLVPLTATPVKNPRWSNIGEEFIGDGKYGEIVYQSPIRTSAGDVHFPAKSNLFMGGYEETGKGLNFPNYFSHVRYEDMADGKTRKILETQSDLMQKENLSQSVSQELLRGETPEQIITKYKKTGFRGILLNDQKIAVKILEELKQEQKLVAYNSNDPLAQLRTFREEVKRAAKDGKDTILIPSGETAMKIEGLGETSRFMQLQDGRMIDVKPVDLKVGKEIEQGVGNAFNESKWIITDVLGENTGKFRAVPKDTLVEGMVKRFPSIPISEIENFIKNCL